VQEFRSGFVVVLGRPNAGKSTLVNLLAGKKVSIVTPRPQTTRRRILAIINLPSAQLVLADTPGLAAHRHKLDDYLYAVTESAGADADAAIVIVDAKTLSADISWVKDNLARLAPRPCMLLINKLDLMPPAWHLTADETIGKLPSHADVRFFSAKIGYFAQDIVDWCVSHLPPGPAYFPPEMATDQPEEWQVAELVREQVILALHLELPYAAAVTVDELEHTTAGRINIHATIYMERESQKPIVIGEGAQKVKRIGIEARKEIAEILGAPVDLFLTVAVLTHWRDDERSLERLGFTE
jgi:GTP-binding protein Era